MLKQDQKEHSDKDEDKEMEDHDKDEEVKQDPKDLIAEYDEYLKAKAEQRMEVEEDPENAAAQEDGPIATFNQNLDKFDYMDQKAQIRARFHQWLSDERERTQSL